MTRDEAAKILDETPIKVLGITDALTYCEALEMAVKALREQKHKEIFAGCVINFFDYEFNVDSISCGDNGLHIYADRVNRFGGDSE